MMNGRSLRTRSYAHFLCLPRPTAPISRGSGSPFLLFKGQVLRQPVPNALVKKRLKKLQYGSMVVVSGALGLTEECHRVYLVCCGIPKKFTHGPEDIQLSKAFQNNNFSEVALCVSAEEMFA